MIKYILKVLSLLIVLTSSMVLYVHGQIAIFQVSYDLNQKVAALEEKEELYREIKFEVEQLKAPRLLESKLESMQLNLALPEHVQIIKVPVPAAIEQPVPSVMDKAAGSFSFPFDFLGKWVKVAQAKVES